MPRPAEPIKAVASLRPSERFPNLPWNDVIIAKDPICMSLSSRYDGLSEFGQVGRNTQTRGASLLDVDFKRHAVIRVHESKSTAHCSEALGISDRERRVLTGDTQQLSFRIACLGISEHSSLPKIRLFRS